MEIDENNLRIPEWLEAQACQRLVEGDLFTFQNPVIPLLLPVVSEAHGKVRDPLLPLNPRSMQPATMGLAIAAHYYRPRASKCPFRY